MSRIKNFFSRWNCFSSHDETTKTSSTSFSDDEDAAQPRQAFNVKGAETARPNPRSSHPITLIVSHGAFSAQFHYQPFLDAITNDRKTSPITRALCPQQTSSGSDPPPNSFENDIRLLHDTMSAELTSGNDILLICHSYGGIPGCEALHDLPSNPGRVLGIIFVSSFVADPGQSLVTSLPGPAATWVQTTGALSHALHPATTLFNTLPASRSAPLVAALVPQATESFLAPTKHAAWRDHPCWYVRDLDDRAMTLEQQDFFVGRLQRGQPRTVVRELRADHAPFATDPEGLARVVAGVVEEAREGERC